jgi:hypothetical protein
MGVACSEWAMDNSSSIPVLLVLAMMAGAPAATAWAQARPAAAPETEVPIPEPPNQPYPSTFHPSFQWNYVCTRPRAAGCLISCPPNAVVSSVVAARVWLGTSELANPPAAAIYYYLVYYNGAENLVATGFVQSTRNLACQALAMKVSYSGPPK